MCTHRTVAHTCTRTPRQDDIRGQFDSSRDSLPHTPQGRGQLTRSPRFLATRQRNRSLRDRAAHVRAQQRAQARREAFGALAGKNTRTAGTHRAPALGKATCVVDRPVRGRRSGILARQRPGQHKIRRARPTARQQKPPARGRRARAAARRGAKPSPTVPQSPHARREACQSPHIRGLAV